MPELNSYLTKFQSELQTFYPKSEISAIWNWLLQDETTLAIPSKKIESWINKIIERLKHYEPVQYILGYSIFYGLKLKVNNHTLIPRPETEELCEKILSTNKTFIQALDVGTGSGCIPIAIATQMPTIHFDAIEISPEAIEIAKLNVEEHQLEQKIKIIHSNILTEHKYSLEYDLIISNPPYINQSESKTMNDTVMRWEPHSALFPEGDDELVFYKKLVEILARQRKAEVELWAEINPLHKEKLLFLFESFSSAEILTDYSGNNRFLHVIK